MSVGNQLRLSLAEGFLAGLRRGGSARRRGRKLSDRRDFGFHIFTCCTI
jgi:hypothetical protein